MSDNQLTAPRIAHTKIVAFLLCFSVFVIAAGFYLFHAYISQAKSKAKSELKAVAELKMEGIYNWRRERIKNLEILQNEGFSERIRKTIVYPDDPAVQKEMQNWFYGFIENYNYRRLCLIDMNGKEVMSTSDEDDDLHVTLADYTEALFGRQEVIFIDFYKERVSGKMRAALMAGMFDFLEGKKPLGAFIVKIDAEDYIFTYLKKWPVPRKSAETLLVRMENGKSTILNTYEGKDHTGDDVISYIVPVEGTPWHLITKIDTDEVFSRKKTVIISIAGAVLLLIVSVFLILLYFTKSQKFKYYKLIAQQSVEIKKSEEKFRSLFDNMNEGFAFHKIVLDENNEPVDYVFLDVNESFEKLTGLKRTDVLNKNATEVLPGIKDDPADWIKKYGKLAMEGESLSFDSYSVPLGKWYSVKAYRTKKEYFAVIFDDISDRKESENLLRNTNEQLENLKQDLEHIVEERTSELEKRKIELEEISGELKTKNIQLEEQNDKLKHFNKLFVGREFRVKELKDQVAELERKLKDKEM